MESNDDLVQFTYEGRQLTLPDLTKQRLSEKVSLSIDGRMIEVNKARILKDAANNDVLDADGEPVLRYTTIYDAACELGDETRANIPILCHREHMRPAAVCRMCVVDLDPEGKAGKLAPACQRPAWDERLAKPLEIGTMATSARVRETVSLLTELLRTDHSPPRSAAGRGTNVDELEALATRLGVTESRFPASGRDRGHDDSSVVIAVDHNACILCDRCVRACNDVRDNQVIGRAGKGFTAHIAFDLDADMGRSSCVSCGECMISCPTGALSYRGQVQATVPEGTVAADELARHPLFEGVSVPFLAWNEGAVRRRRLSKGEVICREGDFGSTAFYIEDGEVEVFLQAQLKHIRTRNNRKKGDRVDWGLFGLVRKFTTELVGRDEDERDEEYAPRFINIDAPVALDSESPIARMVAGDIFGEMTCMSSYPRSATVRAATDCTVLELQRNVLYILQRSTKSRAMFDERYRRRAIDNQLRSVPLFSAVARDEAEFRRLVDLLRDRVGLDRLNPGDRVFSQGDEADAMYLVRTGFVKVAQSRRGQEQVLNYVGPGGYIGEIGLISHLPEIQAMRVAAGRRTATCSALDHVDLVRIGGDVFRTILDEFPAVRQQVARLAVERLREIERAIGDVESVSLPDFLSQGLYNAQSLLVLDLEKCTRCDECTKACSDAHEGVTRLIREGLRFDKFLVASSCRSCLDPFCLVGCPVNAIHRGETREILIADHCIGCGKCAENCPYGNINMHAMPGRMQPDPADPARTIAVVQQKATTCDLCISLDGQPSCVYACPHDAAHRMTGAELRTLVQIGGIAG
jgi:CRP-like cAMP-binding protein/Fe-S-cluster-containing dehydrogenase component